jgi:Zn-dependent protease with chaperone function
MRFFEQQQEARARTTRMVLLFALAVAGTALGVHLALALCWWLMNLVMAPAEIGFPRLFFTVNVGVTLLLVLGGWWIETTNLRMAGGAERLARRIGAREARPGVSAGEQRLCNIVDEVCIAAHMQRPMVMVMPRHGAINAFATGWDEQDAVVAVTQGALDLLTRDELQGMVAHECSHIHEGDTRLNMQLAGMVSGLELVWHFGDTLRDLRGVPPKVIGTAIMAVGSVGWLAGRCLQAAVSREREFLADARAVQWTRSRDGLGGVLRKAMTQRAQPDRPSDPAWPIAVDHLLLLGDLAERGGWLDSHPPLATRIRRIYGRSMPPLPLVDEDTRPAMPA